MHVAKDISKSLSEKLVIAKVLVLPSRNWRVDGFNFRYPLIGRWRTLGSRAAAREIDKTRVTQF